MSGPVLVAAYGRIYTSLTHLLVDWNQGKDFYASGVLQGQTGYCSIRDFPDGQPLQVRYGLRNDKAAMIHRPSNGGNKPWTMLHVGGASEEPSPLVATNEEPKE